MTHEQADFDAIASLLAAALLQKDAFALLPRKMNRNVKAFIELYGGELPFYLLDQLPKRSIDKITLVDTQSLVTLKGMGKKTKVHVVDHHTPKVDFPVGWTSIFKSTGACVTILIEDLQKSKLGLNTIFATLLLIGIYEDTGSLSYASTTPQDMLAAAFLLENNASLSIAIKYLNPPLSDNQQKIYDLLLKNTTHLNIHGHHIAVAKTNTEIFNEEISSIAHKLRDYLDPDGLFLLVKTVEGIRLVARSTIDQVDVSKIAQIFDGGGHARAAAALIPLEEGVPELNIAYQKLLDNLPYLIEPSIKVADIMSRDPLLIKPDTSALSASHLMQRYGYEGYPVIHDGKIVGLLNRRSVDRAITHKLDLTAASLMEAGDVFTYDQSSLDDLQKIMTSSGWGQIPVRSSTSDQIVGIVTRTDLIKALGEINPTNLKRKNLSSLLNQALTTDQMSFLQLIATHAFQHNLPIYLVGGFVRDLILERPGFDLDIVVEGDAITLANSLVNLYKGKISTHKRFRTAKWIIKDNGKLTINLSEMNTFDSAEFPDSIDFISARTEFYEYPTALPEVESSSIKLDLHRRDFSINTLAMRLDGRHFADLYDFWGGLEDLQAGVIRVLHSLSFVDDPTRLIRAVRFEQRFGFEIEPRTLQLLIEASDLISQVSGDRLRHELNLILKEKDPFPALERLQELELLSHIHPDLTITDEIKSNLSKIIQADIGSEWNLPPESATLPLKLTMLYITWFMDCGKNFRSIIKRLRMPAVIPTATSQAKKFKKINTSLSSLRPSQITEIFDTFRKEVLLIFSIILTNEPVKLLIYNYVTHWQKVKPFTTGLELQAAGITPGPIYKEILSQLRDAWLDQKITSVEDELQLLNEIINQK